MPTLKSYISGSFVDFCSVHYKVWKNGAWVSMKNKPLTLYAEDGTPYQFQCIVAPLAATVTVSSKDNTSITYSIDMPDYTNVDTLEFYLDGVKTGDISPAGNPVVHTEPGLNSSTQYDFYVISINAAGSAQSNIVTETTHDPVPSAPTLSKDSEGADSVTLSWTEPQYSDTYTLYRNGSVLVSGLTSIDIPYTDNTTTGSDAGTSYDYEVTAVNETGESLKSNTVTYIDYNAPNAPTGLTCAGRSAGTGTNGQDEVVLSWTDPSQPPPVDKILVERKNVTDAGSFVEIAQVNTGVQTYNDTPYVNGGVTKTIRYRLRATGPGGLSGYTAECETTYDTTI